MALTTTECHRHPSRSATQVRFADGTLDRWNREVASVVPSSALSQAYPDAPGTAREQRQLVEGDLQQSLHLRDRAAHHEPIHRRDRVLAHETLADVLTR